MEDAEHRADKDMEEPRRRHGDRRKSTVPVDEDERASDRRANKPGLWGLLRDLFRC